jgi:hypothetical protein
LSGQPHAAQPADRGGLARLAFKRRRNACNGRRVAIKLGDQDFKVVVDCRNGSGDVIQRLGNIVLRVIVSLCWNEGARDADWPAARSLRDMVFSP